MNSITIQLQHDDLFISQVRKMFAVDVKHFPSTETRLEGDATIVESAVFESALLKLQLNKASILPARKRSQWIVCLTM